MARVWKNLSYERLQRNPDCKSFTPSIREYGLVHRVQKGQEEDIFIQDNFYFLCDVETKVVKRQLDDYEAEERFTLEYVNPICAIRINREVDHGPTDQIMLEREAKVLEMMIQEGIV